MRYNPRLTTLLLALSFVCLTAFALAAYRSVREVEQSRREVLNKRRALTQIADLDAALRDAGSSIRGYVITGQEEFLNRFPENVANVRRILGELADDLQEDLPDHGYLAQLSRLVEQRLDSMHEVARIRRSEGKDAAEAHVAAGHGKRLDDRIAQVIAQVRRDERELLERRSETADANAQRMFTHLGIAVAANFCLVLLVFFLFRRDLRQRENRARQSAEEAHRLRELYDQAPVGYFSVGREGRLTEINQTLLDMLSLERTDALGRPAIDFVPPEERRRVARALAVAIRRENLATFETTVLRSDGTRFDASVTARIVRNSAGRYQACRATTVDISVQKSAQDALLKARRFSERVVNTVREPLIIVGQDLVVRSANRSFFRSFRTSPEETEGKPLARLLGGQLGDAGLLQVLGGITADYPVVEEFRLTVEIAERGQRRLEINARRLEQPEEDAPLLLLALEDITDRENAVTALRRSQELFRKLFENSPDAIVLVEPDRRIAKANTRANALFGWPEGTLQGQLLDVLLPARLVERHIAHLAAYFKAPRARPMGQGLELFGRRRDGSEFPVDIMLSPMDLEEGTQALAVIRDITARRKAEEEIKRLNETLAGRADDLEYANKELEAFSYSVSHDLRAPLRHINGFADMLKSYAADRLDDKGRRYLDTIVDAAKKMGVLIDELLVFSRMGRSELKKQPVNLAAIVEEVKGAAERQEPNRRIGWTIETLPEVEGDLAMLRQALFNLVSNAIKYSRHRDQAEIAIGMLPGPAEEHVFFVRDNGAGFDMQYAHKLFGVFQRLHGSSEFEGTGVGLAIVRRIVQRHGGRTWAEGAVGQGATFYFSLPKTNAS